MSGIYGNFSPYGAHSGYQQSAQAAQPGSTRFSGGAKSLAEAKSEKQEKPSLFKAIGSFVKGATVNFAKALIEPKSLLIAAAGIAIGVAFPPAIPFMVAGGLALAGKGLAESSGQAMEAYQSGDADAFYSAVENVGTNTTGAALAVVGAKAIAPKGATTTEAVTGAFKQSANTAKGGWKTVSENGFNKEGLAKTSNQVKEGVSNGIGRIDRNIRTHITQRGALKENAEAGTTARETLRKDLESQVKTGDTHLSEIRTIEGEINTATTELAPLEARIRNGEKLSPQEGQQYNTVRKNLKKLNGRMGKLQNRGGGKTGVEEAVASHQKILDLKTLDDSVFNAPSVKELTGRGYNGKTPWSDKYGKTTSKDNLAEHAASHADDFRDPTLPEQFRLSNEAAVGSPAEQYGQAARNFFENPPEGTLIRRRLPRQEWDPTKQAHAGEHLPLGALDYEYVYYNAQHNIFGAVTSDGVPKTFFRSNTPYRNFLREGHEAVNTGSLVNPLVLPAISVANPDQNPFQAAD